MASSGHSIRSLLHCFPHRYISWKGFRGGSVVKNLPANAGAAGLIPGSGRSPGGGNGNPIQYFSWDNPMDRGAWRATVHGVTKSQTQLKWLGTTKKKDLEACLAVNSPEEFTHFTADTTFDLLSVGQNCYPRGQPSRHCGQRLEAVMGVTWHYRRSESAAQARPLGKSTKGNHVSLKCLQEAPVGKPHSFGEAAWCGFQTFLAMKPFLPINLLPWRRNT